MIRAFLVALAEVATLTAAIGVLAWLDRDRPLTGSETGRAVL
jgi:hypothetical protein